MYKAEMKTTETILQRNVRYNQCVGEGQAC